MIDTVNYTSFLVLLPHEQWLRGWKGWKPEGSDGQPFHRYDRFIKHGRLGIRLSVRDGTVVKVEVDLPKLLYGHNGRLIKTQKELNRAFVRLKQALQTVCHTTGPTVGYYPGDLPGDLQTHYTRIDLVWQFDLNPGFVFLALRNAKHPEINKAKGEWRDQTLVFPGTKMRISIYDKKAKERARCAHNVLRFEVQLHGEKIDKYFGVGDNDVLRHIAIDTAYAAYRNTLLGFGSDFVPESGCEGTITDFVALMVARHPDDDPVGLYCLIRKLCSPRSRKFRKEVGLRVPHLVHFSWANLLPEKSLPPVVEIVDDARERKADDLFEAHSPAEVFATA